MLGIIGAMDIEVDSLKAAMKDIEVMTKAGMDFNKGMLEGREVVVVRSGIGKVNAAVCTQILVDSYSVSAIINTGIAGSLKNEINIGDIVLAEDVVHHDMDAVGFGYAIGQIPGMKEFSFPADETLRTLARECCKTVGKESPHRSAQGNGEDISVFEGRIVSGDQFVSDKKKKTWLIETFDGLCTEMEGAAIGQAAWLNHIPFLVIRAISDKADDSATMDYSEFEAKAAEHSVSFLKEIASRYQG